MLSHCRAGSQLPTRPRKWPAGKKGAWLQRVEARTQTGQLACAEVRGPSSPAVRLRE